MRWWLLVLVACGGVPVSSPPRGGETLAQMLEREVGAGVPVAIVPGPTGLRAISADFARTRVLAPSATWALVDNRANVIWFGEGHISTVYAIDLDEPASKGPVVTKVVDGLPDDPELGNTLISIRYGGPKERTLQYGGVVQERTVIVLEQEPKLARDPGPYDNWGHAAELEAALAKATLDRAVLAKFAARGAGKSFTLGPPTPAMELRVPGVATENCDEPVRCGHAEAVLPTKLWRVTVGYSCGDGCYPEWKLYDPATKQFLDNDWTGTVHDAWVARDGSAFVQSAVLTRFDRGSHPDTPYDDMQGGGWLGGAYYYE